MDEQINNLLIETSEEETDDESSEDLNQIHHDNISTKGKSDSPRESNVLTKEQDLLFEAINSIPNPQEN